MGTKIYIDFYRRPRKKWKTGKKKKRILFACTYFWRGRGVRPAHGSAAGARPPVHVGRVPPGPGHRRRGHGRTGRGEAAGSGHGRAAVIVGHVQVGPVVDAHRQQGHGRAVGRRRRRRRRAQRAVADDPIDAERVARQHGGQGHWFSGLFGDARRNVTAETAAAATTETFLRGDANDGNGRGNRTDPAAAAATETRPRPRPHRRATTFLLGGTSVRAQGRARVYRNRMYIVCFFLFYFFYPAAVRWHPTTRTASSPDECGFI